MSDRGRHCTGGRERQKNENGQKTSGIKSGLKIVKKGAAREKYLKGRVDDCAEKTPEAAGIDKKGNI